MRQINRAEFRAAVDYLCLLNKLKPAHGVTFELLFKKLKEIGQVQFLNSIIVSDGTIIVDFTKKGDENG